MSDAVVQLPADGAGKKLDAETLTVGANTVYRERIQLSGAAATDVAVVTAANGLLVDLGANNDVSLNAGTNNIGDVDVLTIAAGDNNIGNVDIVTVPAPLSTTGTGTEATALRVTVATDSTGVLSVDDNGGSLTVDGTVAVTGVATEAKQDTQITHLATIAGDTTDIETAVELIDDTVATLGTTTYTEATTKGLVVGAVRRDADTTLVDTTNEVSPLQVDANGRLKVEAFSGETLPVSLTSTMVTGTVAVTQSGTWDEVGINDSGNSITVDNTDVTAAAVSLAIIDDWDETDRAKVNIISGQAGVAAGVGASGATVQRVVQANDAGKTLLSAGGSASTSGNNTLVAAGTNRLKVIAFSLTTASTTAMTCIFQSGASGTEIWRVLLQAATSTSTGANLSIALPGWLFATASATLLNLNLSSANAVHWSVTYYDEA